MSLSARPFQISDIPIVCDYWMNASPEYLRSMGADATKMPTRSAFETMLSEQLATPIEQKKGYATIWCLDEQPIGHCNINQLVFGDKANMHLHLWKINDRLKGKGTTLVKLSLPLFFNTFNLQNLYCEPYSENPAPNKTLSKLGFEFIKKYRCVPGNINFEQEVNQWVLSRERFEAL